MPIKEDADQTYKLFAVGDQVVTPDGPGTVTSVQFNTAKYNDRWGLEPPQIVVELEDGTTIHTCLCELELPHTKKGTKLIHQEFDRLWPPIDEEVPEGAEMLIPEGDEEIIEGCSTMPKKTSLIHARLQRARGRLRDVYGDLDQQSAIDLELDRYEAEPTGTAIPYVRFVYGPEGDEPGTSDVAIYEGEYRYWLEDGDETGRYEHVGDPEGYTTFDEAEEAAYEFVDEQNEGLPGEMTAEEVIDRLRKEARDRATRWGFNS